MVSKKFAIRQSGTKTSRETLSIGNIKKPQQIVAGNGINLAINWRWAAREFRNAKNKTYRTSFVRKLDSHTLRPYLYEAQNKQEIIWTGS